METPASPEAYADGRGRRALASYLKYGYIPLEDPVREAFHKGEQVSRTLEYAYDDWALSRMAGALGTTDDEQLFLARARNYRNVIDPATGFARGRHADGTWDSPFDPAGKYPYITEGLPFQYTFFVPQDIEGLISTDRWPRWIHRQTRPAVQREALRSRKRAQPPYRLLIRLRRRTL
jgi:putative alpha-1,2-mannosidase